MFCVIMAVVLGIFLFMHVLQILKNQVREIYAICVALVQLNAQRP